MIGGLLSQCPPHEILTQQAAAFFCLWWGLSLFLF